MFFLDIFMARVMIATGGQETLNLAKQIGNGILVGGTGGLLLVIVAVRDIVSGLRGTSKDWKQVGLGVVSGIFGAAMIVIGVTAAINLFTKTGHDFIPA